MNLIGTWPTNEQLETLESKPNGFNFGRPLDRFTSSVAHPLGAFTAISGCSAEGFDQEGFDQEGTAREKSCVNGLQRIAIVGEIEKRLLRNRFTTPPMVSKI